MSFNLSYWMVAWQKDAKKNNGSNCLVQRHIPDNNIVSLCAWLRDVDGGGRDERDEREMRDVSLIPGGGEGKWQMNTFELISQDNRCKNANWARGVLQCE